MYQILFKKSAEKELERLPKSAFESAGQLMT